MRPTLPALATLAAAAVLPVLLPAAASAATVPSDTATIPPPTSGCTTTYVRQVAGEPVGPVVVVGPGSITVDHAAAVRYVYAQAGHTLRYVVLCD